MKLFFAGDVLLKDESDRGHLLCCELQELIKEQDVVCCNLEGPCIEEGVLASKKRGPSLFQGRNTLQRLKKSGFNTLVLANNHIMDYGLEGLKETMTSIGDDFYYTGAAENGESTYEILEFVSGNKKIGIFSVAECTFGSSIDGEGGCAWMGHESVSKMFKMAKERYDYFFVICHCGAEELEVPLPEVRTLYRSFVDQGATAVIGHHPHVVQGYEEYEGRKIFYSLGNFAFDSLDDPKVAYQPIGLSLIVEIKDDGAIQYEPIVTEYVDGQVKIKKSIEELEKANQLLDCEEQYKKKIDDYCIDFFEKYFKTYILAVIGLDIENQSNCEKFANYRLKGEPLRWDYLFLYHNVAIETNRWICLHAIRALGYLK